jgi:methylthioxylose transferase
MRWKLWSIVAIQAALVALLAVAVYRGLMPLGIRREWLWGVLPPRAICPWNWRALAAAIVAGYGALVGLGLWALHSRSSRRSEALWLTTLFAAAIGVQVAIPTGAPDEYDLTKWAYVNFIPSSSGYYWIARNQAATDPWAFLARYPDWIRSQDSLHIGTHPPGLIVLQCILLRTMER